MIPRIAPDEAHRHDPFPLTEMQQAYWLGRSSGFELGGIGIHLYEELECVGLDLDRLSDAWRQTVLRHDALRTVILRDGRQQVMEETPEYRIAAVDLRGLPAGAVEARLRETRERLSHRVYSVEEWPGFELQACRTDAEHTRLFLSIDLTHLDLHGLGLVVRDWIRAYEEPDRKAPRTAVHFRDYVLALRDVRSTGELAGSRQWWSERVKAMPGAPALPYAKPLAAAAQPRFERRTEAIDAVEWERIKSLAGRAGVTPSCLSLAVYCDVLRLWSTEPAFTVNIALRNSPPLHPALGEVAGMFTSAAPIAAAESSTFAERAQILQQRLSDVLRHRAASGPSVLREYAGLHGKRPSEAVFPVVYTSTLKVAPHPLVVLERLGTRIFHRIQTPQVSLDLQIYERKGELVCHWDTVAGLFPAGVAGEMAEAYRSSLASLTNEAVWAHKSVAAFPAAQREVRKAANATAAVQPAESLDRFAWARVSAHGPCPAVITSTELVTHERLHWAAQRLVRKIKRIGIRTGQPVAVALERGWLQFAAIHAVVMAGGSYVPVAPALPVARRDYLVRDVGARIAITTRNRNLLNQVEDLELIYVDDTLADEPAMESSPALSPDDLAYILYTSGSTGEPKGVMIRHGSVVNRLADINERFAIGPDDRIFAITASHHDLSVYDFFGTIAAGAAAIVPDADKALDPAHWAELMRRHRATVWNSVPAFLEMLVAYLENAAPSRVPGDLRLVLLAGDWIPVSLPGRLRAIIPGVSVVSLGGPTETTIWDIHYPVGEVDPSWTSIPYGKPLRNSRYYVMNRCLEERPDWVGGELFIAGVGLAKGYWNDASKTQTRFIEHPETGERLYRSGDLGRYLPDGNIEFLGRADTQLKVGGIRIEAGEVAAAIRKHPAVADVIVRATGSNGTRRLEAYVVPSRRSEGYDPARKKLSDAAELEHRLRQTGLRDAGSEGRVVPLFKSANGCGPDPAEYNERRSCRAFAVQATTPCDAFIGLLAQLRAIVLPDGTVVPKRLYPSAGSLYPVRTYVCIKPGAVGGIPPGTYYYHPVEHQLHAVSDNVPDSSIHLEHNRCLADSSGFLIVLAAHLPAIEPVYGELARDYCLLEAGYIGQLLTMRAGAFGIGLCPIGDLDRRHLADALRLDRHEEVIHALAGGTPARTVRPALYTCAPLGQEALRNEIASMLRQSLPQELIPQHIVILRAFPLTANGKVDMAALPQQHNGVGSGAPPVPPATDGERRIATILAEVLETEAVCVERKFFEQGCTSLQLVQFMLRLQRNLGHDVGIADLFAHPSVKSLASFLNGEISPRPGEDAVRRAALRLQMRDANGR